MNEFASLDTMRQEMVALLKWKSEAEQTIAMLKGEIRSLRQELKAEHESKREITWALTMAQMWKRIADA